MAISPQSTPEPPVPSEDLEELFGYPGEGPTDALRRLFEDADHSGSYVEIQVRDIREEFLEDDPYAENPPTVLAVRGGARVFLCSLLPREMQAAGLAGLGRRWPRRH